MASVNERLDDLATRHQVYLQQYSTSVVRRISKLLDRVDADIVQQIKLRDPTAVKGAWSAKRLEALLGAIRDTNRDAFRLVGKELSSELKGFAEYEADHIKRALGSTLPVAMDIVTPAASQLRAAVLARPFQGRLLREWVKGLEAGSFGRLRGAIRMGFVEGEGIAKIVQRVAGTRALRYKDGIQQVSRRHTETLVRTAVNHTANYARQQVYEANSELIKGIRWVSTLDSRTSMICASRDGKVYPVKSGPRPPAHPNCRSATAPVIKSWREIGFDVDDLPAGTRASMNGQVPAGQTYAQWLKRQPVSVQRDVLGTTRADLFRKGDLPVDKFVANGKELTLEQLRLKEAVAFETAGL